MSKTIGKATILMLALLIGPTAANANDFFMPMFKQAITKSVPLLQSSAEKFSGQGRCFSCHHQSLTAMAVEMARSRGFTVEEKKAKGQAEFTYGFFAKGKDLFIKSMQNPAIEKPLDTLTIDPAIVVSYGLIGLAAEKQKGDETLGAIAMYLSRKQLPDGRWPVIAARPPMEGSEFAATALSVRVLQLYAPDNQKAKIAGHIARARTWLQATPPKTNEDKIFRLFGLRWANADEAQIQKAVQSLLREQRDDGGWAQLSSLNSDAYATGQALVALHLAGGLPTSDAAFWRGANFLMMSQKPDGSWLVQKRATAVQPYFDAGYPHGESQFISLGGASWATMALSLMFPPTGSTAGLPTALSAGTKPTTKIAIAR